MTTFLLAIIALPIAIRILDILFASAVHAVVETTMPSKPKPLESDTKTDRTESMCREI